MKCPLCQIELKIAERQGIEIDYCPQCRGVWLDRGELDKIIERAASPSARREPEERYDEYRRYEDSEWAKRRKRKSFLGELFDFD